MIGGLQDCKQVICEQMLRIKHAAGSANSLSASGHTCSAERNQRSKTSNNVEHIRSQKRMNNSGNADMNRTGDDRWVCMLLLDAF